MAKNEVMMSRSDVRILRGMKPTNADRIKNEKIFTNTIKKYMGAEIEVTLDDGTKENQSIVDVIVAKKIAYDLEHPEKIDLNMYSKVLGEDTKTVDVNIKNANELFGDIVVKEDSDDYVGCVDSNYVDNDFDSSSQ